MEPSIRVGVGHHPVALLVLLVRPQEVCVAVFGKIILIDEVVPRVVGRVNIYELDLAEVRLLQQLERVQIVAFDEEVLRRVEVHALVTARAKRLGDGCVRGEYGLPLARPVQVVALARSLHDCPGQFLP